MGEEKTQGIVESLIGFCRDFEDPANHLHNCLEELFRKENPRANEEDLEQSVSTLMEHLSAADIHPRFDAKIKLSKLVDKYPENADAVRKAWNQFVFAGMRARGRMMGLADWFVKQEIESKLNFDQRLAQLDPQPYEVMTSWVTEDHLEALWENENFSPQTQTEQRVVQAHPKPKGASMSQPVYHTKNCGHCSGKGSCDCTACCLKADVHPWFCTKTPPCSSCDGRGFHEVRITQPNPRTVLGGHHRRQGYYSDDD